MVNLGGIGYKGWRLDCWLCGVVGVGGVDWCGGEDWFEWEFDEGVWVGTWYWHDHFAPDAVAGGLV